MQGSINISVHLLLYYNESHVEASNKKCNVGDFFHSLRSCAFHYLFNLFLDAFQGSSIVTFSVAKASNYALHSMSYSTGIYVFQVHSSMTHFYR